MQITTYFSLLKCTSPFELNPMHHLSRLRHPHKTLFKGRGEGIARALSVGASNRKFCTLESNDRPSSDNAPPVLRLRLAPLGRYKTQSHLASSSAMITG